MEIEYLRTARKSYMVIKNSEYEFENYELQMLLHNEIPALLALQVIVDDGRTEYLYDVTGMQSLQNQFSFLALGEKQLRFLLQSLIYVKNAMEEYLLDDQNLSFLPSMIFYDRFAQSIRFCYIPGLAGHRSYDIRSLFEELLQHLDHSSPGAVRLGYEMYERSAQSEFLVEDCIDCLTNSKGDKGAWILDEPLARNDRNPKKYEADFKGNVLDGTKLYREKELFCSDESLKRETSETKKNFEENRLPPVFGSEMNSQQEEKIGRFWKKKRHQKHKAQIDYSEILDDEQRKFYAAEEIQSNPETEIFSAENAENYWKLIYKGDGDESDFTLTEFPFWIGTDRERVQGVLSARTVSRVHAKLSMEEDRIYLEDYNSTNGTYVNHRLIPMNTPTELQHGDRIFFATEEYLLSDKGVPR